MLPSSFCLNFSYCYIYRKKKINFITAPAAVSGVVLTSEGENVNVQFAAPEPANGNLLAYVVQYTYVFHILECICLIFV